MDALRALRATDPSPPLVSGLDLGQDDTQPGTEVSEPDPPTCSSCSKLAQENRSLWKQLWKKDKWIKKAKAELHAFKTASKKVSVEESEPGPSGEVDLPGDELSSSSSEERPQRMRESLWKRYKHFPSPILEYMEQFWVYLKGSLGSKKHDENQKSKLGRVMSFLDFLTEGRPVLPNWTFLDNVKKFNEWPKKLLRKGLAENVCHKGPSLHF
ncbi:uncharacterized protein LOC118557306 [Fundulus heteroclitus]|uniref:uncharacterized protein LOC118557306 n=1 Tax=Fundulus heteroclitus TaxID=8078 RepID=UPI00165B75C1|nr:uncharacterized protein LOC118557306 [Fundulus heteroclitus]